MNRFLHFLECMCYIQDLAKKPVGLSQICIVPFSNFDNETFGSFRMTRCLFYI